MGCKGNLSYIADFPKREKQPGKNMFFGIDARARFAMEWGADQPRRAQGIKVSKFRSLTVSTK
jgi:hypothetical protein